jgi:adenosylhomocysteine nucleosidase
MPKLAIVAALEREVRPLVRTWSLSEREHERRRYRFFQHGETVLVCGGIGAEAARRASEAAIAIFDPQSVCSAGFAGALDGKLQVGDILRPRSVIDSSDGSAVSLGEGEGVLVSFMEVASPAQKSKLRESYGAQAVDMEAAAVARAAESRHIPFTAIKAISDAADFDLPPMDRFVNPDGGFSEMRFARFVAIRPWLWPKVARLAANSRQASHALCRELEKEIA